LLVSAAGCGGRAERAESADDGSAGAPGNGEAGASGAGTSGDPVVLVLPVIPREENSLALMVEETATGFDVFPELSIQLALGESYPATVRFHLEDGFMLLEDGRFLTDLEGFTFNAVTSGSEGLGATLVDEDHFELTAREVGDFPMKLEGNWIPTTSDGPSERPFSLTLNVQVRRVASVVWHPCVNSPVRVLEGAQLQTPWHELLGEDGLSFLPANADSSHNVEVTIHAAPDTTLTAEDGLASLVAEGPEQTISVRALGAEIGSFELVHLDTVDSLGARFFFGAHWMRGTTELASGDTAYAPRPGDTPGYIGVAPELRVAGTAVCSVARPEWFELRSNTPDTCSETSELGCGDACTVDALPVVVLAESPGTCELAVDAPESNAGLGTSAGLSVELIPLP
jgi:hypothetical protein